MKFEDVVKAQDLLNQLTNSRSFKTRGQAEEVLSLLEPLFEREHENKLQKDREAKRSWDGIEPLTLARQARRILYKAPYYVSEAQSQLRRLQEEENDIAHVFELIPDLSDEKRLELTHRLTELLQERRIVKRFIELMEPFGTYAYVNKPVVNGMKQIIDQMNKIVEIQEKRTYTPRYLMEFGEAFKQVSPTKEGK